MKRIIYNTPDSGTVTANSFYLNGDTTDIITTNKTAIKFASCYVSAASITTNSSMLENVVASSIVTKSYASSVLSTKQNFDNNFLNIASGVTVAKSAYFASCVNGYYINNSYNNIPLSNGILSNGLVTEKFGGYKITDFSTSYTINITNGYIHLINSDGDDISNALLPSYSLTNTSVNQYSITDNFTYSILLLPSTQSITTYAYIATNVYADINGIFYANTFNVTNGNPNLALLSNGSNITYSIGNINYICGGSAENIDFTTVQIIGSIQNINVFVYGLKLLSQAYYFDFVNNVNLFYIGQIYRYFITANSDTIIHVQMHGLASGAAASFQMTGYNRYELCAIRIDNINILAYLMPNE